MDEPSRPGVLASNDPMTAVEIWKVAGIITDPGEACRALMLERLARPLDTAGWHAAAEIVGAALVATEPAPAPKDTPLTLKVRTEFDVMKAVVRLGGAEIGTVDLGTLLVEGGAEEADASDAGAELLRADQAGCEVRWFQGGSRSAETSDASAAPEASTDTELPPRQTEDEGVATQESEGHPEAAASSEADVAGVASPRCSGSEGVDDRPQQSLQAKPELPPAVVLVPSIGASLSVGANRSEEDATAAPAPAEEETTPAPEPAPQLSPSSLSDDDPAWNRPVELVLAGRDDREVAREFGVSTKVLRRKVGERSCAPAAKAEVETPPAAAEEAEEGEEGEADAWWTPARDLLLVETLATGKKIANAALLLDRPHPDCLARYRALLPKVTLVEQQALIKRLRAEVAEG